MHFQKSPMLVAVSIALALATVHAIDICDLCKCERSRGEVKSVSCQCNSENTEFNITQDKMNHVHHVTTFAISDCVTVSFHKNSFANSSDLQSLTISRVNRVRFNFGVFSSLTSLLVEDVNDLRLEKMAFLGAKDIQDITIHRANISVLPTFALFDVKGLKKVELKGVYIAAMKVSSIKVAMENNSTFIIDSCEVDTIDSGAVDLQTGNLVINNSLFNKISSRAVQAVALRGVDIMANVFGSECSNEGIIVQSNRIEIMKNTFNVLPIGMLTKGRDTTRRVMFRENIVYNFTLNSDGVDISNRLYLDDFKNNEVICDCNLAKTIMAYKAFQSTSEAHIVVEQNFCHLESSCKISLQKLSEEQLHVCDGVNTTDIDILCQKQLTMKPITPPTNLATGGHRGEGISVGPSQPSTDLHDDASHHMASASWNCCINRVLISLVMLTHCLMNCFFTFSAREK